MSCCVSSWPLFCHCKTALALASLSKLESLSASCFVAIGSFNPDDINTRLSDRSGIMSGTRGTMARKSIAPDNVCGLSKKRGILPPSSILPRGLSNATLGSSSCPSGRRSCSFPPVPCKRSRVTFAALSFPAPEGIIKRCVKPSCCALLVDGDGGTLHIYLPIVLLPFEANLLGAILALSFRAQAQATVVVLIAFRDLRAVRL